ncbi:MAG: radical SAM protein [Verrucomicrobia bacterium]|nr:radical SAM protein [Verrucomicrobiota bacterium]
MAVELPIPSAGPDPAATGPGDVRLIKSPHLQLLVVDDQILVYDALDCRCLIASSGMEALLDAWSEPATPIEFLATHPEYEDCLAAIHGLRDRGLLVPIDYDARRHHRQELEDHLARVERGEVWDSLTLVLNERCNFRCTYCMEYSMIAGHQQRVAEQGRVMSREIATTALDRYFALLHRRGREEAAVGFSGGEPFLNWELMRFVLAEATARAHSGATSVKRVSFGLNTNASLVTPAIIAELARYPIGALTVGIDGLAEGNDRVRRHLDGRATFDAILRGLRLLIAHLPDTTISVNAVLTEETAPYINEDFLRFLRDQGVRGVTMDPNLVHFPALGHEALCDQILALRRLGESIGVSVHGFWWQPSRRLDQSGERRVPFNCMAQGGVNLTVTATGNVGPCSYISPIFGRVEDMESVPSRPAYLDFLRRRFNSAIAFCQGCAIEGLCAGSCYVSSDQDSQRNARCDFLREMTRRLLCERVRAE